MCSLSVRTTTVAKRSQYCPHALRGRGQLRRCPCAPPSILLSTRWHQLSNENSLQTAIAHAFPQPSATWEPDRKERVSLYATWKKNVTYCTRTGLFLSSANTVWWLLIFLSNFNNHIVGLTCFTYNSSLDLFPHLPATAGLFCYVIVMT